MPKKKYMIAMDEDLHHKLKVMAVNEKCHIGDVIGNLVKSDGLHVKANKQNVSDIPPCRCSVPGVE
jgi:hypothetical protein